MLGVQGHKPLKRKSGPRRPGSAGSLAAVPRPRAWTHSTTVASTTAALPLDPQTWPATRPPKSPRAMASTTSNPGDRAGRPASPAIPDRSPRPAPTAARRAPGRDSRQGHRRTLGARTRSVLRHRVTATASSSPVDLGSLRLGPPVEDGRAGYRLGGASAVRVDLDVAAPWVAESERCLDGAEPGLAMAAAVRASSGLPRRRFHAR